MKKLYGVIGYPVSHSLSPLFQQAAMESLGIDAAYVPFEIPSDQIGIALKSMEVLGVEGFNVTIPHKESVSGLVAGKDRIATIVGAVNTVSRKADGWFGANTDVGGFQEAFRHFLHNKIKKEVFHPMVLGAGGSVRSVLFALRESGFHRLTIANRSPDRARALLDALFPPDVRKNVTVISLADLSNQGVGECDVLINALSREAFQDSFSLLDRVDCTGIKGFFDLSYRPDGLPTSFLKFGLSLHRPVDDGLRMLLEQGALSFEIWMGQPAPRDIMAEALRKKLGRSPSLLT